MIKNYLSSFFNALMGHFDLIWSKSLSLSWSQAFTFLKVYYIVCPDTCPCSCPPLLTSPEHVFSLQQLNNGRLRGRDQNDAAVLSPAHQATLRRDVNAGCHLRNMKTCMSQKDKKPTGTTSI